MMHLSVTGRCRSTLYATPGLFPGNRISQRLHSASGTHVVGRHVIGA